MEPAVGGFGLRRLVRYGFLDAKAGFGGFGLGLLVSQVFLGAKAGRPDRDAGEWRNLFLLW